VSGFAADFDVDVAAAFRRKNAANQERRGKAPSESTQQDIEKVRSQIARKHEFIEEKRAEQQAVREEFAADIARFKELKGGSY